MTAPDPRTPAEMSVAEKLACEWEARHDVAARGRVADVAPVQHYLTHTRCDDELHRPARHEARVREARARAAQTGLSQWLRWGEEGAADAPVIPRC
jgi:hypothetical protein